MQSDSVAIVAGEGLEVHGGHQVIGAKRKGSQLRPRPSPLLRTVEAAPALPTTKIAETFGSLLGFGMVGVNHAMAEAVATSTVMEIFFDSIVVKKKTKYVTKMTIGLTRKRACQYFFVAKQLYLD